MYQAAVDMAPTEKGSHQSTWGQAEKPMEKLEPTAAERKLTADIFT